MGYSKVENRSRHRLQSLENHSCNGHVYDWCQYYINAVGQLHNSHECVSSKCWSTFNHSPYCLDYFKDKLSILQTLGIILGAAGIVTMVARADIALLQSLEFNIGDLLMLIAIIGFGSYANTLRTISHNLSLTVLMFVVTMAGCLELLPFYVYESLTYMPMPTDWITVGWVAVLAIVTSLFPIYCWNAAVSVVGVNRSAIFVNLMPVFGATLAIIFLGERLYAYHFLGAGLIFIGILLVVRAHKEKPF